MNHPRFAAIFQFYFSGIKDVCLGRLGHPDVSDCLGFKSDNIINGLQFQLRTARTTSHNCLFLHRFRHSFQPFSTLPFLRRRDYVRCDRRVHGHGDAG